MTAGWSACCPRLNLGGAIPSVRALNGRPKPEDVIDGGGMSEPLGRALDEVARSWRVGMAKLTGVEQPVLERAELTRKLDEAFAKSRFDVEGHREALGFGEPELVFKRANNAPRAWWEEPVIEEPVIEEPVIEEMVVEEPVP